MRIAAIAVVAEAACLHSAEALPDSTEPDLAFVDVHLAAGTSGLDVSTMIQRRWPNSFIVFVTANPKRIPDDFAGAHGVIAKPFSHAGMTSALRYLEDGLCDPPPTTSQPPSFVASPAVSEAWAH